MDFKNIFFYTFAMSSIMLSCCIDSTITKIADKNVIHIKDESYSKVNKDIQTTNDTMTSMSKEDYDLLETSTYSKETTLSSYTDSFENTFKENTTVSTSINEPRDELSCICGIFFSSQFVKGSPDPPKGEPVISNTVERSFVCNGIGQKKCQTKCLEQIVQHLPNSANILCASLDRDIRKERAYLFVRNCGSKWYNTNLAAGREYCCKNGLPYNCPKN